MAVELATAYISLIPTAVSLKPAIEKQMSVAPGIAADAGRESGNKFGSEFGSATSRIGDRLGSALKAGITIATAAAGAAGAVGIKTAAAMEQSEIAFTTMLGSGEKAKAFLSDLSKFAAKTPFDMPGLQTAASSLVSAGIDANKVIPIMTSLGNATSGMGTGAEGVKRATVALQQMNAAGKISGEDLNQLRDAGIPVFDLLTAATGKTTEQIAEMAQKGKLGRKELEQLMTALETGKGLERFNGLMEKQSQSLTGLWSTFKDTFEVGMAGAIQPLIPLMKDGLGAASSFLADTVLPRVTGFVTWMAEAIPGLVSLFSKGDYTGALYKAFGVEEDSRIVGFFLDLRDNVGGTITWFRDAISGLYAFITAGDYTGAFTRAFGVEEDYSSVGAMFDVRDRVLGIFANIGDAANGLYALFARGDFQGSLQRAFGWEEDSRAVDILFTIRENVIETAKAIREHTADLWAGLTMSQAEADAVGVPLEGAVAIGRNVRAFFGDIAETLGGLDYSSTDAFFASLGTSGATLGPALGSMGESVKTLLPAMAEFGKQMPDIAGGGVTLLASALGFLADHVDTIIQFMPLIVAGFVAWKVAQLALNAAAAVTPGLQLAVNISRIQAARAEMGLAAAHRTSAAAIRGTQAAESATLVTRIRSTAATIAQRTATVATSAATKAAAAGQWLLNAAMTASPLGIVLVAIGALVAGLVWFFTQTEIGQDIIAGAWGMIQDVMGGVVSWWQSDVLPIAEKVFGFIGDAIKNLVDWVVANWPLMLTILLGPLGAAIAWIIQNWGGITEFFSGVINNIVGWFTGTLVPGIQGAISAVGAVFTWLYENVIAPVFGFIGTVLGGFYLLGEFIFNAFVAIVQKILIPAIVAFWEVYIRPVFQAIGDFISWVWTDLILVAFNAMVDFFTKTIPAAVNWLYDNAIKPVFDAIGAVAVWLFDNVIKPTFDGWVRIFTVIIPDALRWLYDNAIKPIFDLIGNVVKWVWENVISPYLNFWIDIFTNKIPAAAKWLYENGIKPIFDKIGDAIKWVWDHVIKPVFDTMSNVIEKDVPKAFQAGVDFVKTIWEGLQEIVKAPIRFVVNTVLNDGLINSLNGVADFLQIKKLPRIALPQGFADGGYTGPGGKYQPAGVVHAGEFVLTKEQTRKAGVRNLYAMANALDGYVKGGLVHPVPASVISQPFHGGHNGIDFAAPMGTPVFAAGPGRVSMAGWSAHGGGNEIHVDHPNGLQTWYAHLSSFAVKLGEMVTGGKPIGRVGSTGNSTGPHLHYMVLNGGWPAFMNPAEYLTGGGAPGTGGAAGWNPITGIIDGLMNQFKDAFPGGGFVIDMLGGLGKSLLTGAADFITDLFGGASDKQGSTFGSPLVYDGGGWLENTGGAQLVQHNQRRPDAVLSAPQWDTMLRIAEGAGTGTEINFNGPVYGDPQHIVDELEARKRRAATLSNLTSITVGG